MGKRETEGDGRAIKRRRGRRGDGKIVEGKGKEKYG